MPPVEACLVGVLELVEELVVEVVGLLRIEEMAGNVDPDAAVSLLEVLGQQPVGHQMEPAYVHADIKGGG